MQTIEKCGTEVVYTCGPHPMLQAVSRICAEQDVPVQVAVEELMACGYGVCMTCVMPLKVPARQGSSKGRSANGPEVAYARSCTEGPVFDGSQVLWEGETEPVGGRAGRALSSRRGNEP